MKLTIENFSFDNREVEREGTLYRVCNSDELCGTGAWYVAALKSNDGFSQKIINAKSLQEAIDIANGDIETA